MLIQKTGEAKVYSKDWRSPGLFKRLEKQRSIQKIGEAKVYSKDWRSQGLFKRLE